MCEAKANGGRRCAHHARQEHARALAAFHAHPNGDNHAAAVAAEYAYGYTKTGIREMQDPLRAAAAQRVYELKARVAFLERTNTNPEAWAHSCRGDLVEAQKELSAAETKARYAGSLSEKRSALGAVRASQAKVEAAYARLHEAQHLSDLLAGVVEKDEAPAPVALSEDERKEMGQEFQAYRSAQSRYEPLQHTPLMRKLRSGEGVSVSRYHYFAHWMRTDPTSTALLFTGNGRIHPDTISKAAKEHRRDDETLSSILSNQSTRGTDLHGFREHPSEKVRETIASHPNLSAKTAHHLMLDRSEKVKQRLAGNTATAPEVLDRMVWHPSYQSAVLSNPATEPRTLAAVARGERLTPSVAMQIITHKQNTPETTAALLGRFKGSEQRALIRAAAGKPSGAPLLARLAGSNDAIIRAKVAGNEHAGFATLRLLSRDAQPEVAEQAKATLSKLTGRE